MPRFSRFPKLQRLQLVQFDDRVVPELRDCFRCRHDPHREQGLKHLASVAEVDLRCCQSHDTAFVTAVLRATPGATRLHLPRKITRNCSTDEVRMALGSLRCRSFSLGVSACYQFCHQETLRLQAPCD